MLGSIGNSQNGIVNSSLAILDGVVQWEYIVFNSIPDSTCDGSMDTQFLTHNHIELRGGIELVYCWVVRIDLEELFTELGLYPRILCQCK
jgi:hypothetical protein